MRWLKTISTRSLAGWFAFLGAVVGGGVEDAAGEETILEAREEALAEVFLVEVGGNEKLLFFPITVVYYPSIEGNPLDPCVLSHNFTRIVKKAGLENVRFHDLRHTFASLMLLRGAKPKVISGALGHSSVAFTMDVYSHIIEDMQSEAMALLDEVLPAGVVGNSVAKMSRLSGGLRSVPR